jgi:hypothetical protein
MKKQILLLVAGISFSITSLMAQENMQRQAPEERAKTAIEKMAPLNLDAEAKTKTEVVMLDFYTEQQNALKEMRASGNMDREAMMAKRKELADARDAKLKLIFTTEQYKKWADEIEPALRPQRPKN